MVKCPVCGSEPSRDQSACGVCGLPTEFFEPVHAAVEPEGSSPSPPEPGETFPINDTGPLQSVEVEPVVPPGALVEVAKPEASFTPGEEIPSAEPAAEPGVQATPLPEDDTLRIGRSLGLDVSGFEESLGRSTSDAQSARLSRVRREMIRTVLEGLIDRYRRLCDRRGVLSTVMRTKSLDAELAAYRQALSKGNLSQADAERQKAEGTAESLEASLARIRSRLTEASQLMRALREFGGVAPQALRPVADAVRSAHQAEAGQIENRLDKTNGFLWGLLVPRMNHEISQCLSMLEQSEAPPSKTAPIRVEVGRMAEQIRDQNLGKALESHRFLQAELASIAPYVRSKSETRFSIDQVHSS
jgi:hypothetical protein